MADLSRHSGIFPVLLLVAGTALGGCSGGSPTRTVSNHGTFTVLFT